VPWGRALSAHCTKQMPPTVGIFPQNVEVLIDDVTDQVAVQSSMQGVDAVVHLAARVHVMDDIASDPQITQIYAD